MTVERLRIDWIVGDEIRSAIEPYLMKLYPLIPGWVSRMRIMFESDVGTETLSVQCSYTYRWVNLYVRPPFLICSPNERFNTVLHEIRHIIETPVEEFVERLIDCQPKSERHRLHDVYHIVVEMSVQDFTDGLHRYMESVRDAVQLKQEIPFSECDSKA